MKHSSSPPLVLSFSPLLSLPLPSSPHYDPSFCLPIHPSSFPLHSSTPRRPPLVFPSQSSDTIYRPGSFSVSRRHSRFSFSYILFLAHLNLGSSLPFLPLLLLHSFSCPVSVYSLCHFPSFLPCLICLPSFPPSSLPCFPLPFHSMSVPHPRDVGLMNMDDLMSRLIHQQDFSPPRNSTTPLLSRPSTDSPQTTFCLTVFALQQFLCLPQSTPGMRNNVTVPWVLAFSSLSGPSFSEALTLNYGTFSTNLNFAPVT